MHTKCWSENFKVRGHLQDVGVNGRVISRRVLEKYGMKMWTGFGWLRIGSKRRYFLHGN
jgi:hypothetical protein